MLSETDRKILLDLQGKVLALEFMLGMAISCIARNPKSSGEELLRGIVSTFEVFGTIRVFGTERGPLADAILDSASSCIERVGNALLGDVESRGGIGEA